MRRVGLAARRAQQFLRRPPPPRWRGPALVLAALTLPTLAIAGTLWWAVASGTGSRVVHQVGVGMLRWSVALGLRVEEILVDGRLRTGREAIVDQLGIHAGDPILALDPDILRQRLEDLTWVERAEVARLLPHSLQVRLVERRPLALWQRGGMLTLIDQNGLAIGAVRDHPRELAAFRDLRVLVGEDAPPQAARLFALLSTEPKLWSRVVAATLVGGRRWTVRLDNQIDVLLPEHDLIGAWRLLAARAERDQLLERAIDLVDLRFLPERIRVRIDPAALAQGQDA